jgi:hypothetical protein
MIQEDIQTITLDDYCKILEFLSRTPKNHIGIIGGEPTLHPQFEEILKETNKYCREVDTGATLFTNGIELEKWMPYIGERIGILINCNGPKFQSSENFQKQRETLDHLSDLSWFDNRANCGCNIFPGCDDYSYIWDIVDRYKLTHLRTSVVSPAATYISWRNNKEGYYDLMKPIFLKFCQEARDHKCMLNLDCGHIPLCYFTSEEKEFVMNTCTSAEQSFCEPVVDITPEFKATACFGSWDPVDIRDFDNVLELERYLLVKKNLPKVEANCTGRCASCKRHKMLQCQGGCLGFGMTEE